MYDKGFWACWAGYFAGLSLEQVNDLASIVVLMLTSILTVIKIWHALRARKG